MKNNSYHSHHLQARHDDTEFELHMLLNALLLLACEFKDRDSTDSEIWTLVLEGLDVLARSWLGT